MHFFLTNQGKVRAHNEDSGGVFHSLVQQDLAIVADGMGGHKAGDVASELVVEYLMKKWQSLNEELDSKAAEKWMEQAMKEANEHVFTYAQTNQDCLGMGTTAVVVIYGKDFITIGNIGDSRCYHLSDGELYQITEDHSLVNELVRSGQITKEDAAFHPRKNVLTKALGTEEIIHPDVITKKWKIGDKLLLCSDGLSNKFEDQEFVPILLDHISLSERAEAMVETANARGGEDNITLIISEYRPNEAGDSSC